MLLQPNVNIVTLGVSNVAKATAFYEDVLGWTKTSDSNQNITFLRMNGGGMLLSLYQSEKLAEDARVAPSNDLSAFKGFTVAHLVSSEDQVNAVFQGLPVDHIVKKPEKAFWGGYSGYFKDLDMNMWEVAYNPYIKLTSDGLIDSS